MLGVATVVALTACKKEVTNPDETLQAKLVIVGNKTSLAVTSTNKIKNSNYENPKVWMQSGKVINYSYNKVSDNQVNIEITTTPYQNYGTEELFHQWQLANGKIDTMRIGELAGVTPGDVIITLR